MRPEYLQERMENVVEKLKSADVYIDLATPISKQRKVPTGCRVIGRCCDMDGSMDSILYRSDLTGRNIRVLLNGSQWNDVPDDVVARAMEKAQERLRIAQEGTAPGIAAAPGVAAAPLSASASRSRKSMYAVYLDDESAERLRAYGDGNLSAGARMAAALLVGM